jgi:hypothetical protein
MNHKRPGHWPWTIGIYALALLSLSGGASAQDRAFTLATVVKRGVPTANGESLFTCTGCQFDLIKSRRALNDDGDVLLFTSSTASCPFNVGGGGDYVISRGNSIRIADFCHETPLGLPQGINSGSINNSGDVSLQLAGPGVPSAVMLFSNQALAKIAAAGDPSPAGSTFRDFSDPCINNNGDVVFSAHSATPEPLDGIFKYSNGTLQKLIMDGDPSPIGGVFDFFFDPNQRARNSDSGYVLFQAGVVLSPSVHEKYGLFLMGQTGISKIEVDGDFTPDGKTISNSALGDGNLNNAGQVAFRVPFKNDPGKGGIYRYTNGAIEKIVAIGDSSPIGGTFSSISDPSFFPVANLPPAITGKGAVVFKALVDGGSADSGIFMGLPGAVLKIIAPGDKLPDGETVSSVHTFAVNEKGQVAFFAYAPQKVVIGVYIASPVTPTITNVQLKTKGGVLQLRTDGTGFVTNNSIIEIDGQALSRISYPTDFQQNGGTSTRLVSKDGSLDQLIPVGRPVQITVFNSMTGQRSSPFSFSR